MRWTKRNASEESLAVAMINPSPANPLANPERMFGSSSTIRIRKGVSLMAGR